MTGSELKQLRHDLGDAIGRPLMLADMARLCGLAPTNGAETIRKWEAGAGPSGPVAALLAILRYASLEYVVPTELVHAGADALSPDILDEEDKIEVDSPAAIAENVFRDIILAEVRRRLAT